MGRQKKSFCLDELVVAIFGFLVSAVWLLDTLDATRIRHNVLDDVWLGCQRRGGKE
jgi:hypothetical protein